MSVIIKKAGPDADQRDSVAHNFHSPGRFVFLAEKQQFDFRALGTANSGNSFLGGHVLRGLAVNSQNDVARLEPGLVRGSIVYGGNHDKLIVFRRNFDAHAKELAGGGLLHFLESVPVQEGGVGVKAFKHTLDRPVHQFIVVHLAHIAATDEIIGFAKALFAVVFAAAARAQRRAYREPHHWKDEGDNETKREQGGYKTPHEKSSRLPPKTDDL
jgi:hypothetical protein